MTSYLQPHIIIAVLVLPITTMSSDEIDYRKIPCSAIPSLCSTSISNIQANQNPTCLAEEEISLDNTDLWSFNLGNGSPDPNNMTNPNPNYPREVSMHLPGWGNLELQNYDTHSINREGSSDGSISIKASIRNVTIEDLQTGADYILRLQSFDQVRITWPQYAYWDYPFPLPPNPLSPSAVQQLTSDVMPNMNFYDDTCIDPNDCKRRFISVGCKGGDLTHCRIALVWNNWSETAVLVLKRKNGKLSPIMEMFAGEVEPNMLWKFTQTNEINTWHIENESNSCFLATNIISTDETELACLDNGGSSKGARWRIEGIFSSRMFSNIDFQPPYSVKGHIQIPNGVGVWPTFWLLPAESSDGQVWPYTGEIDMLDTVHGADIHQVIHVKDHHGGNPLGIILPKTSRSTNEYLEYGVEVFDDNLIFSFDGKQTYQYIRVDDDNYPFTNNPFNIVIDLAVGGYWGATDGVDFSLMDATMKIKNVTFCNRYEYSITNHPNMSKAEKSSKMSKKSKKTKAKKSDRSIFNRIRQPP